MYGFNEAESAEDIFWKDISGMTQEEIKEHERKKEAAWDKLIEDILMGDD